MQFDLEVPVGCGVASTGCMFFKYIDSHTGENKPGKRGVTGALSFSIKWLCSVVGNEGV